jgi:hypothetical protein
VEEALQSTRDALAMSEVRIFLSSASWLIEELETVKAKSEHHGEWLDRGESKKARRLGLGIWSERER